MPIFRKKPVEVEARRYVHRQVQDAAPMLRWIRDGGGEADFSPLSGSLLITTLEGTMEAKSGDWIIHGTEGEFYPCKPASLAATFEEV